MSNIDGVQWLPDYTTVILKMQETADYCTATGENSQKTAIFADIPCNVYTVHSFFFTENLHAKAG